MNHSTSPIWNNITVDMNNLTSNFTHWTEANAREYMAYFLVVGGIAIFGTVGNSVFLCTIIREKKLRTVSNFFIGHLAFVDLLNCCVNIPWHLVITSGIASLKSCQYATRLIFLCPHLSMFTQCLISFNRYFLVVKPLSTYRKWFRWSLTLGYLASGWVLSIAVVILISVFGEEPPTTKLQYCDVSTDVIGSKRLSNNILAIFSCVYFVVALRFYGKLIRHVRQCTLPLDSTRRADSQLSIILFFLLSLFVVCLIISPVALYIHGLGLDRSKKNSFDAVEQTVTCILFMNYCVNAVFYGFNIRHFRQTVRGMFFPCTIVAVHPPGATAVVTLDVEEQV